MNAPPPRLARRLALLAAAALAASACAGAGIHPDATPSTFAAEPAVNVPATTGSDPGSAESHGGGGVSTTTVPAPTAGTESTTTTGAGNAGDDDDVAVTTTITAGGEATTTTVPAGAVAQLPSTATVERLRWTGTMELSAMQDDGSIGTTSGEVSGAHVAPNRHRTDFREVSRLSSASGTVLGERTMDWAVGVVGDRAWFEQDGDVEEMSLDQAHRFVPYLSSALDGVVPTDEVLADLADRDGTDLQMLGRPARRVVVPNADVELYAPVFLRYTPALYGTTASGTVASVEAVVDVATGALVAGALSLEGTTAAGGDFEVTVSFEVTAIDDRSIQVLIPG